MMIKTTTIRKTSNYSIREYHSNQDQDTDSIVNTTRETETTVGTNIQTSHLAMETATREKGTALDQQITSIALDTTTQEVITKRPTGQQTQLELKLQIVG